MPWRVVDISVIGNATTAMSFTLLCCSLWKATYLSQFHQWASRLSYVALCERQHIYPNFPSLLTIMVEAFWFLLWICSLPGHVVRVKLLLVDIWVHCLTIQTAFSWLQIDIFTYFHDNLMHCWRFSSGDMFNVIWLAAISNFLEVNTARLRLFFIRTEIWFPCQALLLSLLDMSQIEVMSSSDRLARVLEESTPTTFTSCSGSTWLNISQMNISCCMAPFASS